jgi:hypothetical protein
MHRKFCGYTAAEGYGEAWYGGRGWNGENWRDMAVHAVINWKPCAPEAHVGLYLRSSRETWHQHQVAAGRMAYALRITEKGICLCKQEYNETLLAEAPLSLNWGDQLKLTFTVKGSRITVEGEDGILMEYTDPMPLTAGRVGISASTDGLGFESLILCPAE